MSSRVDGQENDKTTINRNLSDLIYDDDGALSNEKKPSDALNMLRTSAKEACRHGKLFRTKVHTYNDRIKTGLCKVVAAFLKHVRDATRQLVK